MAQFENLPFELLQSIIRDILDELWGGVHTKQFLDSRRVCREFNCIPSPLLSSAPMKQPVSKTWDIRKVE
jgi:hypothetical protein